MRHLHAVTLRSSLIVAVLGTAGVGLLAGCGDAGADDGAPASDLSPSELPSKDSSVVAEIIAHLSPSKGSITFEPVPRRAAPGLNPQSIEELTLSQDDNPNSGLPATVELITNSVGYDAECPAPYQANTFCGNVTLQSFYNQSLANVFVQATSIIPSTGHNAVNSDASEFGLDSTFGLWKYTSPAASTAGVLGQSPFNTGTRDWVFANPDNADTSIFLRVVASRQYASYVSELSSASFTDACAGGSSTTDPSAQQTLPFPFTLYKSTNTTVRYNTKGMITFGSVTTSTLSSNVALPSTSSRVPRPGLFVFWDNLTYGLGGKMCYKVVGSAPNRKAVITWNNMTFGDAPDFNTASLQFGAILSEGTNNIDVVYNAMNGSTTRPGGDSATVGVQNEEGSAATAKFNSTGYGTGKAYRFVPIP